MLLEYRACCSIFYNNIIELYKLPNKYFINNLYHAHT